MATAVNRVELASIRLGNDLARIVERLRRATVQVSDSLGFGQGSGVIWSAEGLIVTNAHVVRRALLPVKLSDGREFTATLVSRDARRDLAVLRIEGKALPTLTVRDATSLRVGFAPGLTSAGAGPGCRRPGWCGSPAASTGTGRSAGRSRRRGNPYTSSTPC